MRKYRDSTNIAIYGCGQQVNLIMLRNESGEYWKYQKSINFLACKIYHTSPPKHKRNPSRVKVPSTDKMFNIVSRHLNVKAEANGVHRAEEEMHKLISVVY